MKYEMMVPPFEYNGFESLKKKEANKYFEWYIGQVEHRIEVLKNYIDNEGEKVVFDYSPESLISLWEWYENQIQIVDKSEEEMAEEFKRYPVWMHNEIARTKISLDTLKYGMDIAVYFAEVVIRNCNGKVKWGFFTSPKNRMSVNEPTLLGFKGDMDLNPRLIVINCTRRSSVEKNHARLFDMYNTWMTYTQNGNE